MIVAIHQPNYLPWCGYFAKIAAADVFVLLDDVPLSNGPSFVSRTAILGPRGRQWLTVPISRSSTSRIADVRSADSHWPARHVRTLQAMYGHAGYAHALLRPLLDRYDRPCEQIADFNADLLLHLLRTLEIRTPILRASQLQVPGSGSRHLLALVQAVGGTAYLSGPSGRKYLDPILFAQASIAVRYAEYTPLPYPQPGDAFVPALSLIDALFHVGPRRTRELLAYRPL